MKTLLKNIPLRLIVVLIGVNLMSASATSIRSVKIEELYREADLVAVVRILSGDGEHYDNVVYKAEVLTALKGAAAKARVFFGPYESYGVGSEYLVFLRRSETVLKPKSPSSESIYGPVANFYLAMYGGYSIMPIEYICVFEGKEISQQCDDGIKLNPKQIVLPKAVTTFPPGEAGELTNYDKWVRKTTLIPLIETFGEPSRP